MRPAGTTRRSRSPSPARIPCRASPRASSRRRTRGLTTPQPRSPGAAATRPGTSATRPSGSSTTRPRPRRLRARHVPAGRDRLVHRPDLRSASLARMQRPASPTCDAAKTYAGPDASAATRSAARVATTPGTATPGALPLKYDATARRSRLRRAARRTPHGWYSAPLTVSFSGGDATSGLDSCDPAKSFSGPDERYGLRLRAPAATRPGTQAARRSRSSTTRRPPQPTRGALPPAERERLVQRSPHRQLRGDGCHLDGRLL